jgi:hypothetical protein
MPSVPIDLPSALRSALDVSSPAPSLRALHLRGYAQLLRERRRRVRAMLAAASLIVAGALFAGGTSATPASPSTLASIPAPAPIPQAT